MPAQAIPAAEGGAPSWRTGWMLGWMWSPKGSAAGGAKSKANSPQETLLDSTVDREEKGGTNQGDDVPDKKVFAGENLHATVVAEEQPPAALEECGGLQLKRTASLGSQDSKDDDAWARKTQSPWRLSVAGSKKFACSRQARRTIPPPPIAALAAHGGCVATKGASRQNPCRVTAQAPGAEHSALYRATVSIACIVLSRPTENVAGGRDVAEEEMRRKRASCV